jgi:hypothetical protein
VTLNAFSKKSETFFHDERRNLIASPRDGVEKE